MACIKAFKKRLGIIVKPKVDVKTFNLWVAEGVRPKEGEHAVKVANLRLFHVSQCRKLTPEEAKAFKAKAAEQAAKRASKSATVVPINGAQPSA